MARCGLIALMLTLVSVDVAAQGRPDIYTGFATFFLGAGHAGDVDDLGWTPGASVAVVDSNGFGAEVDLSYVVHFNSDQFEESGITTFTVNGTWVYARPGAMIRPYVLAGIGVLRTRACVFECQTAASRTDWAMDAGGGAFVAFNDIVGVRGDVRYFRYLERQHDLPTTADSFFDFWRTSAGVVISWPLR